MNRQSGYRSVRSHAARRFHQRWTTRGSVTPSSAQPDWRIFETQLREIETAVQVLRQRFEGVQTALQEKQQLEDQLRSPQTDTATLKQLKQRLEELELELESALFDWRSLLEPFWQAVRFGGLGILIGWLLRGFANR